jgi:hypothetical protein
VTPEIRELLTRWRSLHRPSCLCGACEDTDALLLKAEPMVEVLRKSDPAPSASPAPAEVAAIGLRDGTPAAMRLALTVIATPLPAPAASPTPAGCSGCWQCDPSRFDPPPGASPTPLCGCRDSMPSDPLHPVFYPCPEHRARVAAASPTPLALTPEEIGTRAGLTAAEVQERIDRGEGDAK